MDPLTSLRNMFPEVDARILRGAVLEHGSDIQSSIDFILSEVLTPEQLRARVKSEDTWNHISTGRPAASHAETINDDLKPASEQGSAPEPTQIFQTDGMTDVKEGKAVNLPVHTQESASIPGRSGIWKCTETSEGLRSESLSVSRHGFFGCMTDYSISSTPSVTSCPIDVDMGDVCTDLFLSSQHTYDNIDKHRRIGVAASHQLTAAGQDPLNSVRTSDVKMYGRTSAMQRSCLEDMQGSADDVEVIGFPVGLNMLATGHGESSGGTDAVPAHGHFMPTIQKDFNSSGCPACSIPVAVLNDNENNNNNINDDDYCIIDESSPELELIEKVALASVDTDEDMLEKPGIAEPSGDQDRVVQLNTLDGFCKMHNDGVGNSFDIRHDIVVPEPLPPVELTVKSEVGPRTPCCDMKGELHIDFVDLSSSSHDSETSREENFESACSALADTAADGETRESMYNSSSQAIDIDSLDQIVQQAKLDKDELVCQIKEIHALQLEIELVGAAARQARMEAANGGVDILAKAEEIRQCCSQTHQANEIHAGEVYGEKAILSTEARELQSRLHHVMEEKAKALTQIHEVKTMLQSVLDRTLKEKECADFAKLVREVTANNILHVEKSLFDKVEQHKKELEYEAEACTKLRDFLIDRGSVADSLQGEVAVLCEDVEVLRTQAKALLASTANEDMEPKKKEFRGRNGSVSGKRDISTSSHRASATALL